MKFKNTAKKSKEKQDQKITHKGYPYKTGHLFSKAGGI